MELRTKIVVIESAMSLRGWGRLFYHMIHLVELLEATHSEMEGCAESISVVARAAEEQGAA